MTEPVTAADVMRAARQRRYRERREWGSTLDDDMIAGLREACGGGDIVILRDGTLATTDPVLCLHTENDTLRADDGTYVYEGPGTLYELVPVASLERGA